jgi:UDP-glucose 4-epimerase
MKGKVVVIGGSGFLGSHLADTLSESGYHVVIFDKIHSPWQRDDQEMVVGDILNEEHLSETMKGAEFVYHLAGIADIDEAASKPMKTIEANIIGSTKVIEACLVNKIKRFVFASTVYVYSQQGSFYRVSKQTVELLLESYHEAFGLNYTILRYGSLYGPRAQKWNGLKKYISQAVRDKKIKYPGTGNEKREYIHVRDAARLSVDVLAPRYANKCLTLTGTQVLTSKELLEMIKEIIGKEIEIEFRQDLKDPNHYNLTPYRFTPREARKIIPNEFFDLGQGILDLIEEIYKS